MPPFRLERIDSRHERKTLTAGAASDQIPTAIVAAYVGRMAVLGIDIGGSGVKGGLVDVRRGTLVGERFRVETPESGDVAGILERIDEVVSHFNRTPAVGLTFPGVVTGGTIRTAANLDPAWIGQNLPALVKERLGVEPVVLNDADAAAVAEAAHGAAKGARGVVLMLTFGTGVGSGLLVDGKLVPNTELGHLSMKGKDAEKRVAESVREKKNLSWKKWAGPVNDYFAMLEALFSPDLFVVGGGIAKAPDKWLPLMKTRSPVKVATLGNLAGIVGAAMTAHRAVTPTRRAAGARSPRSSARPRSR
ncbi:MAG TPA: ROK family protein [Mycobacteriales bacterium]|nr:ROK family protein [Mycobacteriales bacterium]